MNPALRVRARVVKPEEGTITVGVPIHLIVEARHAPGGVALIATDLQLPAELGERKPLRRHERSNEGELELDSYHLELVPFAAGIIEIPPLELALGSTVAQTEPLLVTVESTLTADEQRVASSTQAEALPVLENMAAGDPSAAYVRVQDFSPLFGLTLVIFLVGCGLAIWRLVHNHRLRPKEAPPPPPPRPAHEVALEQLDVLAKSEHLRLGAFNPYFTELSLVLRTYVGRRFNIDAIERTVDELMYALDGVETPGVDRKELQWLLAEADQIKFAKYQPTSQGARDALAKARAIVQASREDKWTSDAPASPPSPSQEEASSP